MLLCRVDASARKENKEVVQSSLLSQEEDLSEFLLNIIFGRLTRLVLGSYFFRPVPLKTSINQLMTIRPTLSQHYSAIPRARNTKSKSKLDTVASLSTPINVTPTPSPNSAMEDWSTKITMREISAMNKGWIPCRPTYQTLSKLCPDGKTLESNKSDQSLVGQCHLSSPSGLL